jgi:proline dehydrogenase
MLRSLFIYLSKAAWARHVVTRWAFAWRAASRFVAGEKLEDAMQVVRVLNEQGINATLDHLGEHTTTPDEAVNASQAILSLLEAIDRSGVNANVSIKLTQIGMALDFSLCESNLARILESARDKGNFVRIDMEDSPWTDLTLELYRKMATTYGENLVGVVIQAYLYRSEKDLGKICTVGGRVRLCKGAYKEPPEIAFPRKADVDSNYDRLAECLLDSGLRHGAEPISPDHKLPPLPGIATHDIDRIQHAKSYSKKIGLPPNGLEFQMLYGIRRDLQEQLVAEGYPVRVYVPYGTEWYPYFTRRLAERPANLWFFLSNLIRR